MVVLVVQVVNLKSGLAGVISGESEFKPSLMKQAMELLWLLFCKRNDIYNADQSEQGYL